MAGLRFVGVVLYDADRIEETAKQPDDRIIEAQRDIVLDPHDPKVIEAARKNGIEDNWVAAAQDSPSYKMFKQWRLSLPHHAEFRTVPMNFYLPPLSPILHLAKGDEGGTYDPESAEFFNDVDKMRIPVKFLANIIGAGNESLVMESLKKQMAVRIYRRQKRIGDVGDAKVKAVLADVGLTEDDCEEIFKLVALGDLPGALRYT